MRDLFASSGFGHSVDLGTRKGIREFLVDKVAFDFNSEGRVFVLGRGSTDNFIDSALEGETGGQLHNCGGGKDEFFAFLLTGCVFFD